MSVPAGDVADRLERLAAHAPAAGVDPEAVWSRGRRWHRRRTGAVLAGVAVLGLLSAAVTPALVDRAQPVEMASSEDRMVLPAVVRPPGGWEPAFDDAPGRLSAVGTGWRAGWWSPRPALWGVSAASGESRWLDLPAESSGDVAVLSADGTKLAYWVSVGVAGTRTDDQLPAPTELRLLDLLTGDEQRWAPTNDHGLMTGGMAWAGDTLWFNAGAFSDAEHTSARLALHTWTWGSEARDVSELYTSIDLSTVTSDTAGFLAAGSTATNKTLRVTAAGGVTRLDLRTDGTVSTPAMNPDETLVAGVQQGRREQLYGTALPLLVSEAVDGGADMRRVEPVDAAYVLGWRSPAEVVVASPSDRDGNGEPDAMQVSVTNVTDPADFSYTELLDVQGTGLPQFAAEAWTAEVVSAPGAPFAPDPRLVGASAVVALVFGISLWRELRRRRGRG